MRNSETGGRRYAGVAALLAISTCLGLLAACAGNEKPNLIVLQDPASGRIVPCGPPPNTASADPAGDAARCAAAFEQQGYRRLSIERE